MCLEPPSHLHALVADPCSHFDVHLDHFITCFRHNARLQPQSELALSLVINLVHITLIGPFSNHSSCNRDETLPRVVASSFFRVVPLIYPSAKVLRQRGSHIRLQQAQWRAWHREVDVFASGMSGVPASLIQRPCLLSGIMSLARLNFLAYDSFLCEEEISLLSLSSLSQLPVCVPTARGQGRLGDNRCILRSPSFEPETLLAFLHKTDEHLDQSKGLGILTTLRR